MREKILEPLRLLRQPPFLAVALSHLMVDVLNGQMGILLAVLSTPLGLTHAAIGLIATMYAFVGSLAQPLFGWLTDRHGARWAAAGGVLAMALFFALVAVSPGYWAIVCLILGSVGSAAYHPSGAMKAAQIGQRHMAGQMATAASIFFLFGQGGLSLGPALGGAIIDHLGRPGTILLAALAVPVGVFVARALRPSVQVELASPGSNAAEPPRQADLALFTLATAISGLRVWAQVATTTFAPKFYHDLGLAPTTYGAIVAVYMGGSAVGGVIGALLSQRWGARLTVVVSLALSALPFYWFPLTSGVWVYPLAALAGLFNGAPHSILITLAQRSLPGRAALASGIILGSAFATGSFGAYLSGLAADRAGLVVVLQANAALSLVGALVGLGLRAESRWRQPAVAHAGD
jgi:FSR family fosmidomycin resistance protein-like MFS transporter